MRKIIFLTLFSSLLLASEYNSDYHQLDLPVCIMQKDVHYYTSFQLLITEAQMRGLEYAINNSATNADVDGHMEDIDFHFKFGGKLALGYLFDYDRWDLRLTGSIYYSSASDKAHQPVISESTASAPIAFDGQGLVPVWIHPSAYSYPISGTGAYNNLRFADAKAKWNLDFYNAELELGKFFKVGEKVVLRPAFGLKSIFTYQKFRIEYLNSKTYWATSYYITPSNSDIHLQTNGNGVGPKVGIETRWFINSNFKLIFDATGALLYTFFRTSRRETDNYTWGENATSSTFYHENFNVRSSFTSLKPYAGINIGAGWEKCFESKKHVPWKCTFDCTYFLENYWKMNNMIKFNDDFTNGTYLSDNTDLQMQSIITAFSFSF